MVSVLIWVSADDMFANTQMPAVNVALPDVCYTPIPFAFVNVTSTAVAIPNILNQFIMAMPNHNLMTQVPISFGDEPGIFGGVVSGTTCGLACHIMASRKVFINVCPATRMTDVTLQNRFNAVGATMTPSQPKVMIFS